MLSKENIKSIIVEYSSLTRALNTDKGSHHAYEELYPDLLIEYADREINLLEVGVACGVSLKMWQEIFPKAKIYGADANYGYLKYSQEELADMVLLPQGNQTDPNIFKDIPMMDIIIDDASHEPELSTQTFNILKDRINKNGIYIIEDVCQEHLPRFTSDFLRQFDLIDLRRFKNRGDDMALVYKNKCV
jgi:hypothetical protein